MPRHSREQSGTGIYHVMLRGVDRQDLLEQISAPLEMIDDPLDKNEENTVSRSVSDSEARELLRQSCGIPNICEIQTLERKERNEILEIALIGSPTGQTHGGKLWNHPKDQRKSGSRMKPAPFLTFIISNGDRDV